MDTPVATQPMRTAVVVLGGSGGVGAAVLEALVRDRDDLVAWATYRSDEAAIRDLSARVPGLHVMRCDLGAPGDLDALAAAVATTADRVEVLAHVALEPLSGPLLELGHVAVEHVVATSGTSLLAAVEAFDALLSDGSAVAYLTSIGAYRIVPRYGAVAAAKAVGEALVRYLASELATRGVRVNALSAGPVPTKAAAAMVGPENLEAAMDAAAAASPRRRRLELSEVGEAVRLICSPEASGITGQVVLVDGGLFGELVLTPAQLDR